MSNEIKVSIVVPVYNVEPYLRQCLDSLCGQTMKEIEIICVDDGSTDNCLKILQEYAKKDPRFLVLENKIQGPGAAHARNMGIDHATGEYLLILDSDDYFSLELAEKTYHRAKETDADIVMYDLVYFDLKTEFQFTGLPLISTAEKAKSTFFSPNEIPFSKENTFLYYRSSASTQLYKKSFIKNNRIRFQANYGSDDAFFSFCAAAIAKRVSIVPEILLYYRKNNSNSQVSNTDRNPLAPIRTSERIKSWLIEKNLFAQVELFYLTKAYCWCENFLKEFKKKESYHFLYYTLRYEKLQELGFDSVQNQNGAPSDLVKWVDAIYKTKTPEEYIYTRYHNEKVLATNICSYEIPEFIFDFKEKIILYGAGAVGRDYYAQNIMMKKYNIVAWVDKNHEKIGFPVTGVETFSKVDYEKILIAVENEQISESIKEDLIKLGLSEKN